MEITHYFQYNRGLISKLNTNFAYVNPKGIKAVKII